MQQMIVRPASMKPVIGIGKTLAYAKINPESASYDPTFPKPISYGKTANGRNSSVGWIEAEIDAWLTAQVEKSRKA